MKKNTPPKEDSKSKEIHQPDDKIFRYLMEKKESPAEYIRTHAPNWEPLLQMDSFEKVEESFLNPNLKIFDADVVRRCKFKDSDKKLTLTFLWENKSEPDKYVAIQVGLYMFLAYYKMIKNPKKVLEPILPLIFYNGKRAWKPLTIEELFKGHPYLKFIQPFLPKFDIHFTDITSVNSENLLNIQFDFFKSVMVAMANRNNWDLMFQKFSVIFNLDDK